MQDSTRFIGLDVSKDSIAVGIADAGREAPRYFGEIPNTQKAVRKLLSKLGKVTEIETCFETG